MSENGPPASLLTPRQRRVLIEDGEVDVTDRALRAAKTRIRERVRVGIVEDAPLLMDATGDGGMIAPQEVTESAEASEIAEGIRSTVAVLYRLADAAGIDPEQAIDDGMSRVRGERLERVQEKLNGNPSEIVFPDELNTLNGHGYLSEDAHGELFKRWVGSGQITVGDVREVRQQDVSGLFDEADDEE